MAGTDAGDIRVTDSRIIAYNGAAIKSSRTSWPRLHRLPRTAPFVPAATTNPDDARAAFGAISAATSLYGALPARPQDAHWRQAAPSALDSPAPAAPPHVPHAPTHEHLAPALASNPAQAAHPPPRSVARYFSTAARNPARASAPPPPGRTVS